MRVWLGDIFLQATIWPQYIYIYVCMHAHTHTHRTHKHNTHTHTHTQQTHTHTQVLHTDTRTGGSLGTGIWDIGIEWLVLVEKRG
jgi:hypothetical protein